MTGIQPPYVADALRNSWVHRFLPQSWWPFAQLARWERPIGWWLLMWPCWWSVTLGLNQFDVWQNPMILLTFVWYLILYLFGAASMRGAGCTYNDLVDEEIDDKVERTRSRPLPSGRITRKQAKLFLLAQLLVGFFILIQFNWLSIGLGVLSLVTVAIYPWMKRITWWPQLFLGFAFSWGAWMGWAAMTNTITWTPVLLYAGSICWVIGYDTIYAHQDKEDDAIVGVKSTARLFGEKTKYAMTGLYAAALVLFGLAFSTAGVAWPAWVGLAAGAAHMMWQIFVLDIDDTDQCLALFKSNSHFGWIVFGGLVASALV